MSDGSSNKVADRLVMPSGGALPEGVLDPSIVRFDGSKPIDRLTVSENGHLADSNRAFWRIYRRRNLAEIGSLSEGGQIPRTQEGFFAAPIEPFDIDLLDDAYLQDLEDFQVVLKEPSDKDMPFEYWELMQQRCPQFFLRNVERAGMDTNLPHIPFEIHLYRDTEDYIHEPTKVMDFEPASDTMVEQWSMDTILEQRTLIEALTHEMDWSGYDEWTGGRVEWAQQIFRERRRKKGKFGSEEEQKAEREEDKKNRNPWKGIIRKNAD